MKKLSSVQLSPTSAIVQIWLRRRVHVSRPAQRYLRALDLSAGRESYAEVCKPWRHYDQVIVNRKAAILRHATGVLATHSSSCQVVLMASGWDALGVELAARFPKVKIFEIDSENMEAKKRLIRRLCPVQAKRIKMVNTDLRHAAGVKRKLKAAGWSSQRHTLVLFEGISYYLSETELKALVELFASRDHVSAMLVEYILPFNRVSVARRVIPRRLFGVVKRKFGIKKITPYTVEKLKKLFPDGEFVCVETMHDMERLRTRRNRYFPEPEDGWIEESLFVI